jgi:hypothetical protein
MEIYWIFVSNLYTSQKEISRLKQKLAVNLSDPMTLIAGDQT